MSSYVAGLIQLNYNVAQFIEPNPKNYKIKYMSNSNSSNISNKMRLSRVLKLDGSSQKINRISRVSGRIQFGNFYLGEQLNINYLGKMEGMSGGSGKPPVNRF